MVGALTTGQKSLVDHHTIVVNFHQDFVDSMYYVIFQRIDRDRQIYWPRHTGETWLSKQEEEEAEIVKHTVKIKQNGLAY